MQHVYRKKWAVEIVIMASPSDKLPPKAAGKLDSTVKPRQKNDVNAALRRAYQATFDETIPPAMLDLLDKLS